MSPVLVDPEHRVTQVAVARTGISPSARRFESRFLGARFGVPRPWPPRQPEGSEGVQYNAPLTHHAIAVAIRRQVFCPLWYQCDLVPAPSSLP